MHIFFSGIGGTGIGPLALIAKQAGHAVSGSDKQDSDYIAYLKTKGIDDVYIGQTAEAIAKVHKARPIDWLVYSSAVVKEHPDHPEIVFATQNGIRQSKRDEFLSTLIAEKNLKLVATAGTHGKTTTTAMLIWLLKQLKVPVSYSVGAKLSFGDMGEYDELSQYFVYECDEYDRNFLAFHPYLSLVTGVTWDHPDVYPTRQDYETAFNNFFEQSDQLIMWQSDVERLRPQGSQITVLDEEDPAVAGIDLLGLVDRQNAWMVANAAAQLLQKDARDLTGELSNFPGLSRRFEKLADNIYTDYAHTAEKIAGALQKAREANDKVAVVYEGLHNSRQHFMLELGQFENLFDNVNQLYWVPSYLARENPDQEVLSPTQLVELTGLQKAKPAELNDELWSNITDLADNGTLVLLISAGGGGSLDEWARRKLKP